MRSVNQMHPKALAAIGAACCGPANGVWDPDRRYWVCDYHEGYNDGLEDCEEERLMWPPSRRTSGPTV
jgi:hypothetical protein